MITDLDNQLFQDTVWGYYRDHGRHDLPWRNPRQTADFSPYAITVSELMLQQTQVVRVIPKYSAFMAAFPTLESLAAAELGDVLRLWSGLGYNRRAKFLHQLAQMVRDDFDGVFPSSLTELVRLPGVGKNTAGAIVAYVYDSPSVFLETNIRTVYIHHFFNDQPTVSEAELLALVAATQNTEHPREWYWAIMDYGSHLKQTVGNLNKLSVTYAKQSTFVGSRRQIRGAVLRQLGDGPATLEVLSQRIADDRLEAVMQDLVQEGLVRRDLDAYRL